MLSGTVRLPIAWGAVDWHVHELLFGFVPAVIAGFLLTAVPNWTGRLPVTGAPLLALALLWVSGRIGVSLSDLIDPIAVAGIDVAFLVALSYLVGREIVVGKNWRNLKVLSLVVLLGGGNLAFHVQASSSGMSTGFATRLGIAAIILLIVVIGGRIVPSFTRNWLARHRVESLPRAFTRFDLISVAVAAAALGLWVINPGGFETALAALLAGSLHLFRLGRWQGHRTFAEPLVLILHVGYLFVPAGFLLVATSSLAEGALNPPGALHAWTAGAIGVMTLAVMSRASLGHTGRPLHATPSIVFIYVAVTGSAVLRVIAGIGPAADILVRLAALAWITAFAVFTIQFLPILAKPRVNS